MLLLDSADLGCAAALAVPLRCLAAWGIGTTGAECVHWGLSI